MPIAEFRKLAGTIASAFKIGLGGPQIKNNSGIIEARNNADSAFTVVRGASPVADNDLVTKLYADSLSKPRIIDDQVDTSVSLPTNTGSRRFLVVSTSGSGANIGDLLYDDGSGSGPMTILTAEEGRVIAITDALTGGTESFEADSIYIWDEDGSEWLKIGDIGSTTGGIREIRFVLDNTATQDSTFAMPANARVVEASIEVTTPYSGGATISVGNTATADAYQETGDNNPQTAGRYVVDQDTLDSALSGGSSVVRVAVGGTPAAGAGVCIVKFVNPNA